MVLMLVHRSLFLIRRKLEVAFNILRLKQEHFPLSHINTFNDRIERFGSRLSVVLDGKLCSLLFTRFTMSLPFQ